MADDKTIVLGEFWVDADGEIFVDIDAPLQAVEEMYRYQKIQELQRKLQRTTGQHVPPITPLQDSNRPRQAHGKGKGY